MQPRGLQRRFRGIIPQYRRRTSSLESLVCFIGIYHFVTGGYLVIRNSKDWMLVGRYQRTFKNNGGGEMEITTHYEAYEKIIFPFACGTAYQLICCALGSFLVDAIKRKSETTVSKCRTWLLCITVININELLLLCTFLEFSSMCWMLFRSILEICIVSAFINEVEAEEEEVAARQEILGRLHPQPPQQPQNDLHMILQNMNPNQEVNY